MAGCEKDYCYGDSELVFGEGSYDDSVGGVGLDKPESPDMGSGDGDAFENGGEHGGVLTAGEWNDLDNWEFWGNLMNNQEFSEYQNYWCFYPSRRFAVKVTLADGSPAANVALKLSDDDRELWTARTDNHGEASLWDGMYDQLAISEQADYHIYVDGILQEASPEISRPGYEAKVNEYVLESAKAPAKTSDVAFIVDATGSMADEIAFLKQDLLEVLELARAQVNAELRSAALFYRDEGDEYVTRASQFTPDFDITLSFIKEQKASGGGDFPEAVHTALEAALQDLSWNEDSRSRIAFLVLDAPAHHGHNGVIESLQASIRRYADMGIRIIPLLASGADKTTEMMCRFFAIGTGGTYTFLTDDSGISAGDHVIPSVGKYEVEILKYLLLRLIVEYSE